MQRLRQQLLALGLCLVSLAAASADDKPSSPKKTSGGRFFWTDQLYYSGWHIQCNAVLGYCRLLDDQERQHHFGSYEECRARLDALKKEKKIPPMRGKVVIVLHGILRNREAMAPLCKYLREKGGYEVIPFGYASSLEGISEHSQNLDRIVRGLEGVEEINFVGHSLGNLVIRHYLGDRRDSWFPLDRRIKRIVMLAPPNQGSQLAHRFKDQAAMALVWGLPAHEMANWETLAPRLATPECEFGILAGSQRQSFWRNPLVSGEDDFVVSVEETKLPGARDFAVLPISHSKMRQDKQSLEYTLRFLQKGYFVSEAKRQPLVAKADGASER